MLEVVLVARYAMDEGDSYKFCQSSQRNARCQYGISLAVSIFSKYDANDPYQ